MALHAELLFKAQAELGEGALWDSATRRLLWVDILGARVNRLDPGSGANESWDAGSHVGTVVPSSAGRLMLAVKDGFAWLDPASGRVEMAAAMEHAEPSMRFNDGKCDPAGRFWAGSMAYSARPGAGSLFCLERDGSVSRKIKGVTISNGLGWSPAADKMYYIDSPTQQVLEFAYDNFSGAIERPRVALRIDPAEGTPDGLCVDAQGMLWVALFNGGKAVRFDPGDGSRLAEVSVPGALQTTSCALGGEDLRTLFITSAREHFSPEMGASQPNAGSIFCCRVDAPGLPAHDYRPL